jgi:hypothetical protein
MDGSHIQTIATVVGLIIGLLIGFFGLLTALANLRKAKYEALKAGVPQADRRRIWPWQRSATSVTPNAPQVEKKVLHVAPGLVTRERRGGDYVLLWQARADAVSLGFKPPMVPLWRGTALSDADRSMLDEQCRALQEEMLAWMKGRRA